MNTSSTKFSIRMSDDVKKQIDEYAARKGESTAKSIERACREFLSDEDYWTVLFKRLNRQHKAMTTTNAEVEALIEITLLAIQYMFTLVPELDESALQTDEYKNNTSMRFHKFMNAARTRIEKGGIFDEIFSKP